MDVLNHEQRHRNMAAIHSKNTNQNNFYAVYCGAKALDSERMYAAYQEHPILCYQNLRQLSLFMDVSGTDIQDVNTQQFLKQELNFGIINFNKTS